MIKNLKEICLEKVCLNLNLNYELCKINKLKIPYSIGNEVYDFCLKYIKPLDDNQVNIFNGNIMQLTKLIAKIGDFNTNSYNFLNHHKFKYLKLSYLKNFKIDSKLSCIIETENFYIKNVKFMNFNSEIMDNFFKNSFYVKESITINEMENELFFQSFFYLLEKSSDSLQKLSFKNCTFNSDIENIPYFLQILSNLTNLHKFKLKNCNFNNRNLVDNMLNSLQKNGKTIKAIYLQNIEFSSKTLLEFLKHLNNLEKISIKFKKVLNENIIFQIFQILNDLNLNNFKKIKINNFNCSKKDEWKFIQLLKKCKNLEKISLKNIHGYLNSSYEILQYLRQKSGTLKYVQFDINAGQERYRNMDELSDFYKDFCVIEKLKFSLFDVPMGIELNNIMHTLQNVTISYNFNMKYLFPILKGLACLKTFIISDYIQHIEKIIEIINIHKDNLKKLKFNRISWNDINLNDFFKSILNCSQLTCLHLLDKEIYYSLSTSTLNICPSFSNVIKIIKIDNNYLDDKLWDNFGQIIYYSRNLRVVFMKTFAFYSNPYDDFNNTFFFFKEKIFEKLHIEYDVFGFNQTEEHYIVTENDLEKKFKLKPI